MTTAQTKRDTARKPAATKTAPPSGAKKPADRKPPASTPKKQAAGADLEVTVRGEQFIVERAALQDLELLEEFEALDKGDMSRLPAALVRTLGRAQYNKAKELIRDADTGRVGLEDAAKFYQELFQAINPS
ncbi:hypothetical protein [Georgenia sp. MJ170]|uniref:hypothetical protein n=1 Tax=Georgenia sunbinii TaxID=3117728 RepID=UPI002F263A4B